VGTFLFGAAGILALGAAALAVPRLLIARAQDRLARRLLADRPSAFQILTRAERVAGPYRRVPGVLGLTAEAVAFEGLFGEGETLPTERIQKIATGRRLANGRRLLRLEVLRLTRAGGEELEFVLSPASAAAWRSHLGQWAVAERRTAMDRVTPGR
jgi:hypothetical protein